MYSPWKLLRGVEEWELYQMSLVENQTFSGYYAIEGSPQSYPCLVQTLSRAPSWGTAKNIHRQFFVYTNEAQFLVDFIEGKIE